MNDWQFARAVAEHSASVESGGYILSFMGIHGFSSLIFWLVVLFALNAALSSALTWRKTRLAKKEKNAKEQKQSQQFSASDIALLKKLAKALDK